MTLQDIKQGSIFTVSTTFGFKGDTNRVRVFKAGNKLWVASSSIYHQKGYVKLAPMNKNVAEAVLFNWEDISNNLIFIK